MSKTILITGCSSGIGRQTAILFQRKGWNVVATMRDPAKESELNQLGNVQVTQLDVTDRASIESAVELAIESFGSIDVLVNNAGYGTYGVLEAVPHESIERQFETNVIGVLNATKAVLPHFRERKTGIVVNVSSLGGRIAWPLGSLYHGTKFALEGISEALVYELASIGVRVKLVEPGRVATEFNGRSMDVHNDPALTEYQPLIQAFVAQSSSGDTYRSSAELPAQKVYEAVTDGTDRLRYPSGEDAENALGRLRTEDPEDLIRELKQGLG